MDKLNRDIQRYCFINRFNFTMRGGLKYELTYKGDKIYYIMSPCGNAIFGGIGRQPCFHLSIKDTVANLISIGVDCFVDRHHTKEMVEIAFKIAKDKGCKTFILTDNSYISCPPTAQFKLSDVYFLTTGQTWYESILPIKITEYDDEQMAEYRRRAKTLSWSRVATYLVSKGATLDFIDVNGIDADGAGSAMEVLTRIKKMKNGVSCRFFAEHTVNIRFIAGLISFHGTLWTYTSA
jgi:hypothetical protein